MSNPKGYIKLFRTLDDSDIFEDAELLRLWLTILLRASWSDKWVRVDGKPVYQPKGDYCVSLRELSTALRLGRNSLRKRLDYLTQRDSIRTDFGPRFCRISISNYEKYRDEEDNVEPTLSQISAKVGPKSGQSRTNPGPTRDHTLYLEEGKKDSLLPRARAREEALTLVQTWNKTFAQELIIPQVRVDSLTPSSTRLRTITAALKRHPELGFWTTEVFPRILASDFLTGKIAGKSGEPFKCSFDWVVKEGNLTKILEGNYANKRTALRVEPQPAPDSLEAKIIATHEWAKKRIAEDMERERLAAAASGEQGA